MAEHIQQISLWIVPILVAIVFHEVAHGAVAYRLGDPTAAQAGRLTLNPIAHVDPLGSVIVPLVLLISNAPMLFGWAKPVPVNYALLRNPKRDMVLVAAAGPATNLLLAVVSALALHGLKALWTPETSDTLTQSVFLPLATMAQYGVLMNVFLCAFNLLPIPPLDGGRVLTGLLPLPWAQQFARLEPYGMLVILLLVMTHWTGRILGTPVRLLVDLLL